MKNIWIVFLLVVALMLQYEKLYADSENSTFIGLIPTYSMLAGGGKISVDGKNLGIAYDGYGINLNWMQITHLYYKNEDQNAEWYVNLGASAGIVKWIEQYYYSSETAVDYISKEMGYSYPIKLYARASASLDECLLFKGAFVDLGMIGIFHDLKKNKSEINRKNLFEYGPFGGFGLYFGIPCFRHNEHVLKNIYIELGFMFSYLLNYDPVGENRKIGDYGEVKIGVHYRL